MHKLMLLFELEETLVLSSAATSTFRNILSAIQMIQN